MPTRRHDKSRNKGVSVQKQSRVEGVPATDKIGGGHCFFVLRLGRAEVGNSRLPYHLDENPKELLKMERIEQGPTDGLGSSKREATRERSNWCWSCCRQSDDGLQWEE